jgi:hypothetical protein
VLEAGWLVDQVVKRCVQCRVVRSTAQAIAAVLAAPGGGTPIHTAPIERLHATCRVSVAPLVRRGRAMVHTEAMLTAGMWWVGFAYHLLRVPGKSAPGGPLRSQLAVARAHTSDGRRAHKPPVDQAHVVALPSAVTGVGATHASAAARDVAGCVTTVQWGATRTFSLLRNFWYLNIKSNYAHEISRSINQDARNIITPSDIWITDPPYTDAVNYHELSEFFLAWYEKHLQRIFPD